ncbi:MAG TPA: hypothetical protein VN033_00280 [Vulgatibacter sp.]|nr:hypothetical protein [Vulgatibacter sp.]
MRSSLLLASLAALVAIASSCASTGTFRDGVYLGREANYRITPLASPWSRIFFTGNDLAWEGPQGQVVAVNGVCSGHGDPSLKVLTDHLLFGFEDRVVEARDELRLAGRAALRTRASATLDGVPVELELTVLKKDGCVYDLTYTAPPGGFDAGLATYRALVESFEAPGRPR